MIDTTSDARSSGISREVSRRRTFAIISHPDAGKTTLTEKFLLYGGAVHLAGSVTARKHQRATTSDWMELEKQRGISVSSTVLQFEYKDYVVNLLDTPGHKDFSEDTYRVLTAVDAAVMVIDAGKGIEPQTLKLFEVCRRRSVPIFTFMNKLDRPARSPLELIDELERVLGISAFPLNWPLGDGPDFSGVYDRENRDVHLFERVSGGGAYRAPVHVRGIDDESINETLRTDVHTRVRDDLELLDSVGAQFDIAEVQAGKLTPVFFGSAMNNFGVQMFLDRFLELAPSPAGRNGDSRAVASTDPAFSGFVFKVQANMNPKHRDCVAFIRVVSGVFRRDMQVIHTRTGKKLRLSNSQRLFARERETVDEAFPGDIVGIVGNNDFLIGDTLSEEAGIVFSEMPRFAPESFAYLHNDTPAHFKRFRDGLTQLLKEGVVQSFDQPDALVKVPLLGAVGPLQFDVLQHRLESEYGVKSRMETAPWTQIRWVREKGSGTSGKRGVISKPIGQLPSGAAWAQDVFGQWVVLLPSAWTAKYFTEDNTSLEVSSVPF
jgi:peptide chain release factor 3